MRDRVRQQPVIAFFGEMMSGQCGDLRRPSGRNGIVRQLDHTEVLVEGRTVQRGEEEELFRREIGVISRSGLMLRRGVDVDVQAALGALRLHILPDDDSSGEARPVFIGEGNSLAAGRCGQPSEGIWGLSFA